MSTAKRVQAGVPTGGQFIAGAHTESDLSLHGPGAADPLGAARERVLAAAARRDARLERATAQTSRAMGRPNRMTAGEDSDRLLVLAAREQDDLADYVKDMEGELGIGDGAPERVGQVVAARDRVLAAAARRHGRMEEQQRAYYDRSDRLSNDDASDALMLLAARESTSRDEYLSDLETELGISPARSL